MNTPIISTKYIVTFLLVAGVSACSFPEKRTPPYSQASTEQEVPQQEPEDLQLDEQSPVDAQTDSVSEKHSAIQMRKAHPLQYTVKEGDTLWDISSQFLKDPWYWPEIWHKNRQVENPHLIYPGDILTLIYVNGQPQIIVNGAGAGVEQQGVSDSRQTISAVKEVSGKSLRVVKLSPSVRKQGLDANVITIPGDAIRQFITKPRVVTKEELENAPYILASDDNHLIMGQDNTVYIRGELDKERVRFTVFRPGDELIDPETGEIFGFEAIYAGEAHIKQYGDPAIGRLTSTVREVLIGDRLLPVDKSKINNLYYPHTPGHYVKGQIISLTDALFGIAKLQVAVINRGSRDGLEVGHLLETLSSGTIVKDNFNTRKTGDVQLPDKRSGLMMIFRAFDKVSYGLILESTLVINNHDVVASPE